MLTPPQELLNPNIDVNFIMWQYIDLLVPETFTNTPLGEQPLQ